MTEIGEIIAEAIRRREGQTAASPQAIALYVLSAINEAGFVIVPREPTEAMMDGARKATATYNSNETIMARWNGMIAAATKEAL